MYRFKYVATYWQEVSEVSYGTLFQQDFADQYTLAVMSHGELSLLCSDSAAIAPSRTERAAACKLAEWQIAVEGEMHIGLI